MARYTGPVCRLCRAEGKKLFLKGERCFSSKCAVERRKSLPGMHPKRRGKPTEYGIQLREKQKVRRIYQVLEKQFRRYVASAMKAKGVTGELLLQTLERRLDNAVRRLNFAPSPRAARQYVRHGHYLVNGKPLSIPSYQLKAGDVIEVREKSRKVVAIKRSIEIAGKRGVPEWLELTPADMKARVVRLPARQDCERDMNEQLVVEFYSR